MSEYLFDASRGGSASGIIGLTETDKSDGLLIGYFDMFHFMVKEELVFQTGDKYILGNVQETYLSGLPVRT